MTIERTQAIYYQITLATQAATLAAQAANPSGVQVSPAQAATTYGTPIAPAYESPAPRIWIAEPTMWLSKANPAFPPGPGVPGANMLWALDFTTQTGVATFDVSYDFNTAPSGVDYQTVHYVYHFYWIGEFIYHGPAAPVVPPAVPLAVRYWQDGFEIGILAGDLGNTAFAGSDTSISRDASRTPEGFGFAYRGDNIAIAHRAIIGGSQPLTKTWERFYMRPRANGTGSNGESPFWSVAGTLEGGGHALYFTLSAGGLVKIYNVGNIGSIFGGQFLGSFVMPGLGLWTRVDLMTAFHTGAFGLGGTIGRIFVYLNGLLAFSYAGPNTGIGTVVGINLNQTYGGSFLGAQAGIFLPNVAIDFDDWVLMAYPTAANNDLEADPGWKTALDFQYGSHMVRVNPTGFGPGMANWTGDWRTGLCYPPFPGNAVLTSVVPNSPLEVTTDYKDQQQGCASLVVGSYLTAAPDGTVTIGPVVNGVPQTPSTVGGAGQYAGSLYHVGGQISPPAINTLLLRVTRNATVGTMTRRTFLGSAEFLGAWGPEDAPALTFPPRPGIHNAPYPHDFQAGNGQFASIGTFSVFSGTYVGNDLGQDVLSQIPAHWWFCRQVGGAASAGQTRWWSSINSTHNATSVDNFSENMPLALIEGGVPKMRVTGNRPAANANGSTYQWVAVMDPAGRYMRNGQFALNAAVASNANPLSDPTFIPQAAFFAIEVPNSSASGQYYKGPGHTTDLGTLLAGQLPVSVATFGAGAITSKAVLDQNSSDTAYSAWRSDDGSGAVGNVALTSYVGNGGVSQDVALVLGGRAPLVSMVVPHNATISHWRDPGFVGPTSMAMTGGYTDTAIMAHAVNKITVGATLNVTGVVYDVFALPGTTGTPEFQPPFAIGAPVPPPLPPGPPPEQPGPPIPNPTPDGNCPTCSTLTATLAILASRLQDTGMVHWTQTELTRYLTEAQRTWNALTGVYQAQGSFATQVGIPFYDLPSLIPTLRAYTITDTYMVGDLEYALMEAPTPTAWTGTAQFTFADLVTALQQRRDQFLLESGMVVSRVVQLLAGPPASGRFTLNRSILTLRRLAYIDALGAVFPLQRDDAWGAQSFDRLWPSVSGVPLTTFPIAYGMGVTPPNQVQIYPPLSAAGTLDMLAVTRAAVMGGLGPCLDPATGILLGVPDDWTWVVKFGALATLLNQQGVTYDPQRAAYCEGRFRHGVLLATKASTVLHAKINGVLAPLTSVSEADQYNRLWQRFLGPPTSVYLAGQALVALSPVPPDTTYTVTLDLVRNAPVALVGTDCVAIDDGHLEALLAYAQHLALFKEGPTQLQQGMDLLDQFFRAAGIDASLSLTMSPNKAAILNQTRSDERQLPRVLTPPPIQLGPNSSGGSGS